MKQCLFRFHQYFHSTYQWWWIFLGSSAHALNLSSKTRLNLLDFRAQPFELHRLPYLDTHDCIWSRWNSKNYRTMAPDHWYSANTCFVPPLLSIVDRMFPSANPNLSWPHRTLQTSAPASCPQPDPINMAPKCTQSHHAHHPTPLTQLTCFFN